MTSLITASHSIRINLPIRQCQMLFTPAGEELWLDGWQPRYLHPSDGRTVQGMVFATGSGTEATVWFLSEFSRNPHRARYARVTPASRWGFVDVECAPMGDDATQVSVRYEMQALDPAAQAQLKDYEAEPFAAMIDNWKSRIDARLELLRAAAIR